MKIKFLEDSESITTFDACELPDFTVITGLNGAGKTHLLRALAAGKVSADDIPIDEIKYYKYIDFFVNASSVLNAEQIEAETKKVWNEFKKRHIAPLLEKCYNDSFFIGDEPNSIDTLEVEFRHPISIKEMKENLGSFSDELRPRVEKYLSSVKSTVLTKANIGSIPYSSAFSKALQKTPSPLHYMDEQKFSENFSPESNSGDYLNISLGTIFTQYVVRKFLWVHSDWESTDRTVSTIDLYREFESSYVEPWVRVNNILKEIHENSPNKEVFNFRITAPENVQLRIQDYSSYSFSPQLIDQSTGEVRNFQQLSSGEQVLLALAVSIYQSRDDFQFPELLLLDEIDASLHPSMIHALLETIEKVFVANGTKVILATHSPSTVALTKKNSVYVVHRGRQKVKIEAKTNSEALSLLTEGYATLSDIEPQLSVAYNIEQTELPVLFTEGITDKIIIETSWKKLRPGRDMPFYVQDCFDASFLGNLFRRGMDGQDGIFLNYPGRVLIALFDFDNEGYNCWNGLSELSDTAENDPRECLHKRHPTIDAHALLIPVPNNEDIRNQVIRQGNETYKDNSVLYAELLFYGCEALKKWFSIKNIQGGGSLINFVGAKRKFATSLKNEDPSCFVNVEVLLTKIESIISEAAECKYTSTT